MLYITDKVASFKLPIILAHTVLLLTKKKYTSDKKVANPPKTSGERDVEKSQQSTYYIYMVKSV